MSILFYEENVHRLLRSPLGPVGRVLSRRAELIAAKARENSSGLIVNIRNSYRTLPGYDHGALNEGIHVTLGEDAEGLLASVGTPAEHNGRSYPAELEHAGKHWLTDAIEAGRA